MSGLPDMQVFFDIPVVPVKLVTRMKGHGGPIWPDFPSQVAVRHCRNGIPGDRQPRRPSRMRPLAEPAVWGGFLAPQFGHLVAEHLTRLPQSLRDRPEDIYLFTVQPGDTDEALPAYVWDVLDWYGLRRDRCRIVTRPWLVRELRVAVQGEMLGKISPDAEFLDLLDATTLRNALVPEPSNIVFVTRAGLVSNGKGGHAGESYLAGLLQRLGVRVVDPAELSIRRQMEIYAGARTLIFAEGSALHGRCLLGRVAQDIHVLRRRPQRNSARPQLAVRCRTLCYHEVNAGTLGTRTETRSTRADLEVALFDPAVLIAVFAGFGIELGPHWDAAAYRASVRSDLMAWLALNPTDAEQRAENMLTLADLDLAFDLLPELPAPPLATAPT
jgi:Glycosyltransferase 61